MATLGIGSSVHLVVAMFSYIGYNLLVSKVDIIALDMERAAGEILAFFTSFELPSTPEPPARNATHPPATLARSDYGQDSVAGGLSNSGKAGETRTDA